jgi:hypothetical protein
MTEMTLEGGQDSDVPVPHGFDPLSASLADLEK